MQMVIERAWINTRLERRRGIISCYTVVIVLGGQYELISQFKVIVNDFIGVGWYVLKHVCISTEIKRKLENFNVKCIQKGQILRISHGGSDNFCFFLTYKLTLETR